MKYKPQTKEELKKLVEDKSINLGSIDTSLITDMSELFLSNGREDFSGIETWDVSNVEDMSSMFKGCKEFNQPLNSWDINKVKDMSRIFDGCFKFNQPLDKWDTSNVSSMNNMFQECKSFNQDISNWNIKSVKYMISMFANASSFNQDLNNWDVSNVKVMFGMFEDAESFNYSIENWIVNEGCFTWKFFSGASSFKDIKSILNIYFISKGNDRKKLLNMLENCNIKEVYKEVLKYNKLKDFIKKLENTYYDELKELIENKDSIILEYKKSKKIELKDNEKYKPKHKI